MRTFLHDLGGLVAVAILVVMFGLLFFHVEPTWTDDGSVVAKPGVTVVVRF